MAIPRFQSITEQVAAHLREELMCGRWSGEMPGQNQLVKLLGVSSKTVEMALRELEVDGLLVGQGAGRRRRIMVPEGRTKAPAQKVAILLYERCDMGTDYFVELQHLLRDGGHLPILPAKCLQELRMDVTRVARMVATTEADAWVVCSASREVLEWFGAQSITAFALFGRRRGLPIAGTGPDKGPAQAAAVRSLIQHGHRRIVKLVREERRKPNPGYLEQAFLDDLKANGLVSGQYNLPEWDGTRAGLHQQLNSLFSYTPPTAIIVSEGPLFIATQQHLAQRGITAPRDVSLICTDPETAFAWCDPSVAHINWETEPIVRRIVRWANNVARGKEDHRQTSIKADFVEGGTIGPAKAPKPGKVLT